MGIYSRMLWKDFNNGAVWSIDVLWTSCWHKVTQWAAVRICYWGYIGPINYLSAIDSNWIAGRGWYGGHQRSLDRMNFKHRQWIHWYSMLRRRKFNFNTNKMKFYSKFNSLCTKIFTHYMLVFSRTLFNASIQLVSSSTAAGRVCRSWLPRPRPSWAPPWAPRRWCRRRPWSRTRSCPGCSRGHRWSQPGHGNISLNANKLWT